MCVGEMRRLCEAIQSIPKPVESDSEQPEGERPPSGKKDSEFFIGVD